jgi:Fe-coproporphyrin III synthase
MPKIFMNSRKIELPKDFLERRHYPEQVEYWLSERNGELILNPCRPDLRKLYLEPTTACNLCCRTCIRNSWGMPSENMSQDTFDRIAESMPDLPFLKQVIFSGFGEPLTHPHLLDMIETVRRQGLAVTLATNGVLLDRRVATELVRLGVERVNVSIDGADPQTYQDIRGVRLQQVSENIQILNEVKADLKSLRPSLGIEFVAMRSNVSEIKDLVKLGPNGMSPTCWSVISFPTQKTCFQKCSTATFPWSHIKLPVGLSNWTPGFCGRLKTCLVCTGVQIVAAVLLGITEPW